MKCVVNEHPLSHDLIIGRIFLRQVGLNINFTDSKVTWKDKEIPLHPCNHFKDEQPIQKVLANEPCSTAEACANIVCDDAATEHEETDLHESSTEQVHLTNDQRQQLLQVLNKYSKLFQGPDNEQLGIFPNGECHIDSKPESKAHHIEQPHSVPLNQTPAVKTEIQRQVKLGIIEKCCAAEWRMPMFIMPKTDSSC